MEKLNRKKLFNSLLLPLFFSSLFSPAALALSTDKDQPIELEANYAEMDDEKGETVYKGDVVVIQGSMKITGDVLTVYYNDDGELDTMIVTGKLAHYKQLPDNSEIYDEAWAVRMEYYALKNFIVLIDQALVTQEGMRFSGQKIEYDTEKSQVKARGAASTTANNATDKPASSGRVKLTIKPKKKKE